jgi:hypothetical protein
MGGMIDVAAEALRARSRVFTRRNLFHVMRRGAQGSAMTEAKFDAALRRRLSRGPLVGLLPVRRRWGPQAFLREWEARFPEALLLVDRTAILDLFVESGVVASARVAVVSVDATPAPIVDWLKRGFLAGHRAPLLYAHDAATVIYPFTVEPIATMLAQAGPEPITYVDLGLPPLGATARRFGDPTLPQEELILELEAIPPATLVRYCMDAARRLALPDRGDASARPPR